MPEDLFGNLSYEVGAGSNYLSQPVTANQPLAARLRPRTLDELVGQEKLKQPGSVLHRLVSGKPAGSVFLWGPPGVGKTTIAGIIAAGSGRRFREISAVGAGVKELRAELEAAKAASATGVNTVLFVDEVHRFSKAQQDVLLPAVEYQTVTLIAATTENPSFSVIAPLLSRSLLLRLQPLTDEDLSGLIDRACKHEAGLTLNYDRSIALDTDARAVLIRLAGGDARRLLTYLEAAVAAASELPGPEIRIKDEHVAVAANQATVRYDRDGDQHYDIISAFIKSTRGSDVDASLHYLARMIEAGEDPRFIARRLIILASEDVGMAAPSVLQTCIAAGHAVALIGMPEARINLAQATIACALAPKSNAVIRAIDAAIADVRAGRGGQVPAHLRDAHYSSAGDLGHGVGYQYPHDYPGGVSRQQYLPDDLADAHYYSPTDIGNEADMSQRWDALRAFLRRTDKPI